MPTRFVLVVEKPLNEHFELSSTFVEPEVFDLKMWVQFFKVGPYNRGSLVYLK